MRRLIDGHAANVLAKSADDQLVSSACDGDQWHIGDAEVEDNQRSVSHHQRPGKLCGRRFGNRQACSHDNLHCDGERSRRKGQCRDSDNGDPFGPATSTAHHLVQCTTREYSHWSFGDLELDDDQCQFGEHSGVGYLCCKWIDDGHAGYDNHLFRERAGGG